MMRGVYIAYAVVSWCYFGVSCAGYWAFGNNVMSNVIFSIGHPKWMVAMADLFVTVHVIGSYEVCFVPSPSLFCWSITFIVMCACMHVYMLFCYASGCTRVWACLCPFCTAVLQTVASLPSCVVYASESGIVLFQDGVCCHCAGVHNACLGYD